MGGYTRYIGQNTSFYARTMQYSYNVQIKCARTYNIIIMCNVVYNNVTLMYEYSQCVHQCFAIHTTTVAQNMKIYFTILLTTKKSY